jgi:ubiquinone/menaquinone biosynthesis C-methylase UbiE
MAGNPRREYFNELAASWDSLPADPGAAERIRRFVERSAAARSRRILDLGCGTGVLLPHIVDLHPEVECLVEFDLAEAMLRVNAANHGAAAGRVCADAQCLPFVDACFDLVLCFGVLPHLDDKPSALLQLFRVLRAGGVFCVGHQKGSDALNRFHAGLQGPVRADTLPAASVLAADLSAQGAEVTCAEDGPDWYFVRAVKSVSGKDPAPQRP